MKRLLATLALTCVLSTSALAGSIPTCGITSEETPAAEAEGNIPTGDVVPTGDVANPVLVELIVTLLGIVA